MAYTPSQKLILFKKVIKELEKGTPLRQILNTPGMPTRSRFYDWLDKNESFQERYTRAKDLAASALYDKMLEIASTPMLGETVEHGPNGVKITQADMLGHRRLLLDTIKWRLTKEAPKKYGDKLDVTTGGDKINQVTIFELPNNGRE